MDEHMISDVLDTDGSGARYLSIIDSETELICRYLPDGRLSFVNEAYASYYGKANREILNTNFIPQIPEADLSMILERIGNIKPDSPTTDFEHRVIMADGTERWQHWVHRGIYSSGGELLEHQAVGRDITERKQTEEELRESKARLQAIINASPLAILTIDPAGRIVNWSKGAEGIFGWSEEETIGKVCPTVPLDGLEDFHDMITRVIQGETFAGVVRSCRKKDGTLIHASLSSAVLHNATGEATGVIVILEDISERKQAEAEKEELMNELTDALYKLKILSGIIPICSYCKKIRNDGGYWEQMEMYIRDHSEAEFCHALCPDCAKKAREEFEEFKRKNE